MRTVGRAMWAVVSAEQWCPLAWLAVLLAAAWCHGHWGRWL